MPIHTFYEEGLLDRAGEVAGSPGRPRTEGFCSRLALPQPVTPKELLSEEWNLSKGAKQRLVALQKEALTWSEVLRQPCLSKNATSKDRA